MNNKFTFITPPDVYENFNMSILFVHTDDNDKEKIIKWLSNSTFDQNINIYLFDKEIDIQWLFHYSSISKFKYINIDKTTIITHPLTSYLIGKYDFCYNTTDINLSQVFGHLSNNKVNQIEKFLERVSCE